MRTTLPRVATWLVAVVIGAVFGAAGTVGQSSTWGWFPLGLVVSLLGITALLVAIRLLTLDRWTALATALGAMALTLVLSGTGPGGSVVVPLPEDGQISTGVIWTVAVPIIAAVVIAWPSLPATTRASGSGGPTTN